MNSKGVRESDEMKEVRVKNQQAWLYAHLSQDIKNHKLGAKE